MADLLYKPITLSEMKDYFETTVPHLKAGVWYRATTSASYSNSSSSDDDSDDGEKKNTPKSASIQAQ